MAVEMEFDVLKKALFGTCQTISLIWASGLNFGLIWYENNVSGNRRTLVNKMVALTSLYTLLNVVIQLPLMTWRYAFGPQGLYFCRIFLMWDQATIFLLTLGYNETMILRFLYACCFSTVGVLNEEFCREFLIALNNTLAIIFVVGLFGVHGQERSALFCYCTGMPVDEHCPAEHATGVIASSFMALLLIHTFLPLAILAKRKMSNATVIPTSDFSVVSTGTACAAAVIIMSSVAPVITLFLFRPFGLTVEKNDVLAGFVCLIHFVWGVFIPFIFYCRSGHLRKTVWTCVTDTLANIKEKIMY